MTATTTLRRVVVIALTAIFGLGTSAVPAAFAVMDGCQSNGVSVGCCCGMDGEDCGCGGSCCGSDEDTAPDRPHNKADDTPAFVCLCGVGDSVPAVPSTSPVSVDSMLRASAEYVVEVIDVASPPNGSRSCDVDRSAIVSATTVLRL